MFLKSLDMFGFKSFADKTHLEFSRGITCLIGPNGSGKSNILDAIQWVLGEQASSTLRAYEMSAVIFSGTQKRKPLDYAEVSLVLSNDDRSIPIDTSEVEIKRRLYMDNRSEYFINRQLCRLKDVRALFFNTGIGKNVYSIIQQGRIKEILSAKPEERRIIFEEAAGISGFKQEEKEAKTKLENMDENIKTVMVEYEATKHSYEKLKTQASKVEEYRKLSDKLKTLETRYNVLLYLSMEKDRAKIEANIKKCEDEIEKIQEKQKKAQEKKKEVQELNDKLKDERHKMQLDVAKKSESITGVSYNIYSLENQIKNINADIEMRKERLKNAEKELEDGKIAKEKIAFELVKLSKQKDDISSQMSALRAEINKAREDRLAILDEKKKLEDEKFTNENSLSSLYKSFADKAKGIIKSLSSFMSSGSGKDELEKKILSTVDELSRNLDKKLVAELSEAVKRYIELVNTTLGGTKGEEMLEAKKSDDDIDRAVKAISLLQKQMKSKDERAGKLALQREEKENKYNTLITQKNEVIIQENTLIAQNKMMDESIKKAQERRNITEADLENIKKQEEGVKNDLENLKKQLSHTQSDIDSIKIEISKIDERILKSEKELENMLNQTSDDKILEIKEAKFKYESKLEVTEASLTELANKFYENYGTSLKNESENISASADKSDEKKEEIKRKIQELKDSIKSLGQMNYLAAEDFKEVKLRYELVTNQLEDLNKAREDLKTVHEEIKSRSCNQFLEVFEKINTEYHNFFVKLFSGGDASLSLAGEDPLTCGINITAKPAGKKPRDIIALSGGEQTMTVFALLFAIYKVKPSPFCILDEVESALDSKNVSKFLAGIKEFENITQFIIITHNSHTVLGANTLLGTTQEELGVSKVLSITVDRIGDKTVYKDSKTGKVANIKLEG